MNSAGLGLLNAWESDSLTVYLDYAGHPTVGRGHRTSLPVGAVISRAEDDALFADDLARAELIVSQAVTVPLTDNQRTALECFVFNVGPGEVGVKSGFVWRKAGGHSTLLTLLNAGDFDEACEEIGRWNHVDDEVVLGLTRRRCAEQALFTTP